MYAKKEEMPSIKLMNEVINTLSNNQVAWEVARSVSAYSIAGFHDLNDFGRDFFLFVPVR